MKVSDEEIEIYNKTHLEEMLHLNKILKGLKKETLIKIIKDYYIEEHILLIKTIKGEQDVK